MTPDEFDYFIKQAHRVRAETIAAFVSRWIDGLGRVLVRMKSFLRSRAPHAIAEKQARSRTA